jgi:hypothetical protein
MLHLARGELDVALDAADAVARQPPGEWFIAAFRFTRARALIAKEGAAGRSAIEAEIQAVHQWLEERGAVGQLPIVHEVRAEFAHALGDDGDHRRELELAAQGYERVGATPNPERVRLLLRGV